jgi:hypothetical protein
VIQKADGAACSRETGNGTRMTIREGGNGQQLIAGNEPNEWL